MYGNYLSSIALVSLLLMGCVTGQTRAILKHAGNLKEHAGRKVVIEGRVANEIWQHMVAPSREFPHETYFDMEDLQIVIYSKDMITCTGTVRATGTVVELEGSSKDPRRKESVTEYHLRVDSWECRSR